MAAAAVAKKLDPTSRDDILSLLTPKERVKTDESQPISEVARRVEDYLRDKSFYTWYGSVSTAVAEDFAAILPAELRIVLIRCFHQIEGFEEGLDLVEKLKKIIPLQKMTEATGFREFNRVKALLEDARAKYLDSEPPSSDTSPTLSLFGSLISIIDSIMGALGIADFLNPAKSEMERTFKFQKLMMQLSLFTVIMTMLIPYLGPARAAKILGSALIGCWVFSLIWQRIKPPPSEPPLGINLTKLAKDGKLWAPGARLDYVQEIRAAHAQDKHIVLFGDPGSGKTETGKAFAIACAHGEFPELAGKTIYYFDGATLASNKEVLSDCNEIFKHILAALGDNLDNAVIIIDEMHEIFKNDCPLGAQLKTLLTTKFRFVIGFSTSQEWTVHVVQKHGESIQRRMKEVPLQTADALETIERLEKFRLKAAPHIIIEGAELMYIFEKTRDRFQPGAALHILDLCMKELDADQSQGTKDVISFKKQHKSAQTVLGLGSSDSIALRMSQSGDAADTTRTRYERVHVEEERNKLGRAQFLEKNRQRFQLQRASYGRFAELRLNDSFDAQSTSQQQEIVKVLMLSDMLFPVWEASMREQAKLYRTDIVISRDLIDRMASMEEARRQLTAEQIRHGKIQEIAANTSPTDLSLLGSVGPGSHGDRDDRKRA